MPITVKLSFEGDIRRFIVAEKVCQDYHGFVKLVSETFKISQWNHRLEWRGKSSRLPSPTR